jgi:hypothetical protein
MADSMFCGETCIATYRGHGSLGNQFVSSSPFLPAELCIVHTLTLQKDYFERAVFFSEQISW